MSNMRVSSVKTSWLRTVFFPLSLLFATPAVLASSGAAFADGVNYLPIKPALVVNYGGPGKVKYIKAEISMRVEAAHAAQEVTHHMPLVRDTLIMLLSSMTDEQVSSGEGKEQMRQQALAKVNEALKAQMGHEQKPDKGEQVAKDKKDEKASKSSGNKLTKDDKSKKDAKSKKAKSDEEEHPKAIAHKPLVTDLLFDNLVVQR